MEIVLHMQPKQRQDSEKHIRSIYHYNYCISLKLSVTHLTNMNFDSDHASLISSLEDKTLSLMSCFLCLFVAFQTVDLSDRMGGVTIQAWIEGYDCAKLSQCGQELEVCCNFFL